MDTGPLVSEQITAGKRFLAAFEQFAPVRAAFWLKDDEVGTWYLYVASDQISDENILEAYGEVVRLANQLQDPNFDLNTVKLIGLDTPLAKAVLEATRRFPGRTSSPLNGQTIGGVDIAEMYLYPLPIPA